MDCEECKTHKSALKDLEGKQTSMQGDYFNKERQFQEQKTALLGQMQTLEEELTKACDDKEKLKKRVASRTEAAIDQSLKERVSKAEKENKLKEKQLKDLNLDLNEFRE